MSSATFELPGVGSITMRSYSPDEPIADAKDLLLAGHGYPSQILANDAALCATARFQLAFARLRIGADFGLRAPSGGRLGGEVRARLEEETGRPLLDDVHGVLVFPCDPTPRFFWAMPASGGPAHSEDMLREALAEAINVNGASEALDIAYDLFSASFSSGPNADARFLMLMMAVETLIEVQERPATVLAHVDALIKTTEETTFGIEQGDEERQSLLGSLRWLRYESISRAGKRLAMRLGDQTYMGERPQKFFENCYGIRSRLVHGHVPRPPRQEVDLRAANLEVFVSHLIGFHDQA